METNFAQLGLRTWSYTRSLITQVLTQWYMHSCIFTCQQWS